jgi:hypothetical protein
MAFPTASRSSSVFAAFAHHERASTIPKNPLALPFCNSTQSFASVAIFLSLFGASPLRELGCRPDHHAHQAAEYAEMSLICGCASYLRPHWIQFDSKSGRPFTARVTEGPCLKLVMTSKRGRHVNSLDLKETQGDDQISRAYRLGLSTIPLHPLSIDFPLPREAIEVQQPLVLTSDRLGRRQLVRSGLRWDHLKPGEWGRQAPQAERAG